MWLKFPYFSLQKGDKNPKTEKVNHKSQNLGLEVARFNAIHQDVHIISAVIRIFHADYGTCCCPKLHTGPQVDCLQAEKWQRRLKYRLSIHLNYKGRDTRVM